MTSPLAQAAGRVARRAKLSDRVKRLVGSAFTIAYYHSSALWHETRWLGVQALKSPLDLWVYQEIIWETRPDVIVETGTNRGGSAFFLASICELAGRGRVLSIDLREVSPAYPEHGRITYLGGRSSTDPELPLGIEPGERVMVILDSDHSRDHVLAELERFGPLVTPGCYLIVEDTSVGGHPVDRRFGPGPMDAVDAFVPRHPEFVIDRSREKYYSTLNPRGYLRRREESGADDPRG